MIGSLPLYKPPRLLRSAHVQTVSSSLFRRVDGVEYERERIEPFLSAECFPVEDAEANPHFHLMAPQYGGHVGFMALNRAGEYWSETVAAQFAEQALRGNSAARQAA
jgi:predicted alpha/beta-fold hydrolase